MGAVVKRIRCGLHPGISSKYGYDKTEWEELVKVVKKAKNDLRLLQFENASLAVKNIQKEIDKLNPVFAASRLQELRALREKLDTISVEEQSLLDLTNYNALIFYLLLFSIKIKETKIDGSA